MLDGLTIVLCRNEVSPRLIGKFHMIWLTALSETSMARIFDAILGGFLLAEVPVLVDWSLPLGTASVFGSSGAL